MFLQRINIVQEIKLVKLPGYLRSLNTSKTEQLHFGPKFNSSEFEVFQLLKYSGDFDHFIPHTISILLKNIGHDCGNTSHDKSSSVPKWMSTLPCKARS